MAGDLGSAGYGWGRLDRWYTWAVIVRVRNSFRFSGGCMVSVGISFLGLLWFICNWCRWFCVIVVVLSKDFFYGYTLIFGFLLGLDAFDGFMLGKMLDVLWVVV